MIVASTLDGSRRLEQLYEIGKLFNEFDGADSTIDRALAVVAAKLPLESAILIEAANGGNTDMVVWPTTDFDPDRLRSAKAHAISAYGYLIGARPHHPIDPREDFGRTSLPVPIRSEPAPVNRFIVLPLVVGRRAVFGALQLEGATRLDRDDLEFVNAIANQLAVALDRNRAWQYDVLRRRQAQASQARYQGLVDNLDYACVWEADPATRQISYMSAQFEQIIGSPRADTLVDPDWWMTHAHPDDREQLAAAFARALIEPGSQRCDHRCVGEDGSIRWLHTSLHLAHVGGEPLRLQGVSFDITTSHDAQDRVREQLGLTTAMASSLGEGTLAIDLGGTITFVNEECVRLLGIGEDKLLGRSVFGIGLLETTGGAAVDSPLRAAMRTGQAVVNDDHCLVRSDASRISVRYTATPIHRGGLVTGAVIAFEDISERRQARDAERFLHEAGVALGASQEPEAVAAAVAAATVPRLAEVCFVYVVDSGGHPIRVASAFAEGHVSTTPVATITEAVATAIAGDRTMHLVLDPPLRAPSGRNIRTALVVPLVVGARRLGAIVLGRGSAEPASAYMVWLSDELARKAALAIEHARLYEQARQAVAAREQTLAVVSHDLRSPLGIIVLASSVLEASSGSLEPAFLLLVARIRTAADRMDRMISDLVDFASIEAGRLAMTMRLEHVDDILHDTLTSFEQLARKAHVELVDCTAPQLPPLRCDRERVIQVLANLVSNAIKSARRDDVIRIGAEQQGTDVVFAVADSGPGIAADEQARLFERHWRSPTAGYKGTGLGLAIARGIVDAHGGRIWVTSELGHGATFSFSIPV